MYKLDWKNVGAAVGLGVATFLIVWALVALGYGVLADLVENVEYKASVPKAIGAIFGIWSGVEAYRRDGIRKV